MLLRRFTDIHPKELARDMREFFNSLLEELVSSPVLVTEIGTRSSPQSDDSVTFA